MTPYRSAHPVPASERASHSSDVVEFFRYEVVAECRFHRSAKNAFSRKIIFIIHLDLLIPYQTDTDWPEINRSLSSERDTIGSGFDCNSPLLLLRRWRQLSDQAQRYGQFIQLKMGPQECDRLVASWLAWNFDHVDSTLAQRILCLCLCGLQRCECRRHPLPSP